MDEQIKPEIKKSFNSAIFFMKLDRLAAWTLLLVILSYAITGYGMTKGLINQQLARSLHLGWLGAVGLIAFVIHTHHAISLAFKRWRIWNKFSHFCLFLFYLLLVSFFLYLQFFYTESDNGYLNGGNISATSITNTVSSVSTFSTNNLPVYTAKTLAAYNGLNGQPAYAAVDGLVYDFSQLFRNGNHHGHGAGQDLSSAFHGQHPNSLLNNYTVVGTYK
jgi:predicted heme/steroid binding protein